MLLRLSVRPALEIEGEPPRELAALDAAMLAWLALEGPTPRARLAALLWPERDSEAARNSLRQRLFQMRRTHGVELVGGQATLALAAGVAHDLEEADSVLADVALPLAGEFGAWLSQQRGRRQGRVQRDLQELSEMAEAARDWPEALAHAQELLTLAPLSEACHRRVMRLHYLAGDRAAALLAFDRCERMLKDEIGARPDPQTLALLQQIEQSAQPAGPAVHGGLPAALLRPPRLVGRDDAWRRLGLAWSTGQAVLLRGEAGLGKSRLLTDFVQVRRSAGHGMLLVGARAGDAAVPHALASRLLRALLPDIAAHLNEGVRAELARLLPELGSVAPGADSGGVRLAGAFEVALAAAARQGLAGIALDDLHHADAASLQLVQGLPLAPAPAGGITMAVETAAGPPALRWLFATRPAELRDRADGARDWPETLLGDGRLELIELLPLDLGQVQELLSTLGLPALAGADWAPTLHRRSGGNPMFLLECVKALWQQSDGALGTALVPLGEGPAGARPPVPVARRLIEQRLARCTERATRLLRCAAVAGHDFSAALALRVLGVGALDLADAWSELEAAQVLREGAFAHDLIHEAALASVPGPIAAALHGEIALALQELQAEPLAIAQHWLAAAAPQRARPHLLATAETAYRRGRYAEASAWYLQASDIAHAAGARRAAFDAAFAAAEAKSHVGMGFTAFADRCEATAETDADHAYAAVIRCAALIEHPDGLEPCRRHAEAHLERARRCGAAEAEAELEWTIFSVHHAHRHVGLAMEHGERALALRRGLDPSQCRMNHGRSLSILLTSLAIAHGSLGRFREARARHAEAWDFATHQAVGPQIAAAAIGRLSIELMVGEPTQAIVARLEALLAAGHVHDHDRLHLLFALGLDAFADGRWGAVLAHTDALAEAVARVGPALLPAWPTLRVGLMLAIGRRDLALQLLNPLPEAVRHHGLAALTVSVYGAAAGQPHDTAALLDRVLALDDVATRMRLLLVLAPQLAPAAALPVLALACSAARDGGGDGLWMALQACRAERAASAGRHAEAAQLAREAWDRHRAGRLPMTPRPAFAADLAQALRTQEPTLAAEVAHWGQGALDAAAASLPSPWRETCLARSPLRQRLQQLAARLAAPAPPAGAPG